ncbi:MAG: response regulator [Clostridia bacterium]|jgi:pilus assembly protein CpaE|nr:response regulator [Clostridia bacterium]
MANRIKVVIVDDSEQTRDNIASIISFEKDIEIVGEAENGEEAIEVVRSKKPDIVLMDINMPLLDGIKATQIINEEGAEASIIIMSIQGEGEYLRRAMLAGARDYVVKPFGVNELVKAIRHVYNLDMSRRQKSQGTSAIKIDSRILSVFSTKGGVGKTTVATNLAVALSIITGKKIALLDFDLQFGDVAICLNLYVKNSMTDLIKDYSNIQQDPGLLEEYLLTHYSGIKILAAPVRPENAEYVTPEHIRNIIEFLKGRYDYIIIDTSHGFSDNVITALDMSDTIIYLSALDLPSIKNTKNGLEVMKSLNYPKEKVKVVINKSNERFGISHNDFEEALGVEIWSMIPDDQASVTISVNKGHPLISHRRSSPVSKKIYKLAQSIASGEEKAKKKLFAAAF